MIKYEKYNENKENSIMSVNWNSDGFLLFIRALKEFPAYFLSFFNFLQDTWNFQEILLSGMALCALF